MRSASYRVPFRTLASSAMRSARSSDRDQRARRVASSASHGAITSRGDVPACESPMTTPPPSTTACQSRRRSSPLGHREVGQRLECRLVARATRGDRHAPDPRNAPILLGLVVVGHAGEQRLHDRRGSRRRVSRECFTRLLVPCVVEQRRGDGRRRRRSSRRVGAGRARSSTTGSRRARPRRPSSSEPSMASSSRPSPPDEPRAGSA